ncbi:MAG: hypothetical protein ABWX94_02005 [Candidatus Saccharimonadales bacterium]
MAKDKDTSKHSKHKTHKAPKKVFDITRPGKSPASPNSRSVIVGHKPKVQDDQFVAEHTDKWAGDPSEKRPLMDSRKKIELSPGFEDVDSQFADSGSGEATKFTDNERKDTVKTAPLVTKNISTSKEKVAVAVDDVDSALVNLSVKDFSSDDTADSRAQSEKASDTSVESNADDEHESVPIQVKTTIDNNAEPPVKSNGHSDNPATSELLADLAIEQVVEAKIYDESPTRNSGDRANRATTVDDLLSETGAPELAPQRAIVSTHRHRRQGQGLGSAILIFFAVILIAAIAMNFLLDAEIIRTDLNLPYTDLIG